MKGLRVVAIVLAVVAVASARPINKQPEIVYFDGHMHTTHSDGSGSIADLKHAALARGLSAVIVTNHTKQIVDMDEWNEIVTQCADLSEEGFMMIPSFEVTGSEGLFCRDHVLAWSVDNPFVGDPADALAPEEVWQSPTNPFGTGPMFPEVIREWTDWIHSKGGIAVHAHTSGTTQLDYNVDFIEVINLSHTKDVANFARYAGLSEEDAWNLGVLFNSFSVYGDKYLHMPIDMPNPYYGLPGQPETVTLPLQQALYLGTSLIGGVGENEGGGQWLGTPNNPDLLAAGATPASQLNSWDQLLMSYIEGEIDHPIFGVANSDAHNTANTNIGSTDYDDSDVGEARNGVYLRKFDERNFFRAIRRGNLFATTGPSLGFDVNGTIMGETLRVGTNKTVTLNLTVDSESPTSYLAQISIVKNGTVIYSSQPNATTFDLQLDDQADEACYYRVEVTAMEFADGKPRFAYANPVFVKPMPQQRDFKARRAAREQ